MTSDELYKVLSSEHIGTDAIACLKELDELPSYSSQAALNNMLIDLLNRFKNGETVIIELGEKVINTEQEYIEWVRNYFTPYSVSLFDNSLKKLQK